MKKTTIQVVPIDDHLGLVSHPEYSEYFTASIHTPSHTQIADAWAIYSYPILTLLSNYANVVVINIFGDEGCPWYALQTKQGKYELLLDRSEYVVDNIDKVIEMCETYYKEVEPIK